MRKLIESSFLSLDGYVDAEKLAPFWSPENRAYAKAELAEYDTFLFGRRSYELFAPRWTKVADDPYIDLINAMPKVVASTTLAAGDLTWNATLLPGPVEHAVAELKKLPGKNIIKYGTTDLDRTLIAHRLIDEVRFSIFPVVLGGGKRLFDGCDMRGVTLELRESRTFENGIVRAHYAVKYATAA